MLFYYMLVPDMNPFKGLCNTDVIKMHDLVDWELWMTHIKRQEMNFSFPQ